MKKSERCREYARLARQMAKERPWASYSLHETAEYWIRSARYFERQELRLAGQNQADEATANT